MLRKGVLVEGVQPLCQIRIKKFISGFRGSGAHSTIIVICHPVVLRHFVTSEIFLVSPNMSLLIKCKFFLLKPKDTYHSFIAI